MIAHAENTQTGKIYESRNKIQGPIDWMPTWTLPPRRANEETILHPPRTGAPDYFPCKTMSHLTGPYCSKTYSARQTTSAHRTITATRQPKYRDMPEAQHRRRTMAEMDTCHAQDRRKHAGTTHSVQKSPYQLHPIIRTKPKDRLRQKSQPKEHKMGNETI